MPTPAGFHLGYPPDSPGERDHLFTAVYDDGYLLQPVTAVTKRGSDFWTIRTAS